MARRTVLLPQPDGPIMAVIFFVFAKDDPELVARRKSGVKAPSLAKQFEPLKNLQVWRFSLYYFFVFGAFVALALWMPHYLIDVYGLDVRTAGMSAAAFSLSASLFRAYGGHLSDKFGARAVMYWTFGVSAIATLILSGRFLGFLPDHYAAGFVQQRQMRALRPELFRYACQFLAIVRRSPEPSRAARVFQACLLQAHAGGKTEPIASNSYG